MKVQVSGTRVFREDLSDVVRDEQRPEGRGQAGAEAMRYDL